MSEPPGIVVRHRPHHSSEPHRNPERDSTRILHGRTVPPDRYRCVLFSLEPFCPRERPGCQHHQRIQIHPRYSGMTTGVYHRGPIIFALHVETLDTDTATPACDSIGGRMLAIRRSLDKKPKVCASVGACRRIAGATFSLVEKLSKIRGLQRPAGSESGAI